MPAERQLNVKVDTTVVERALNAFYAMHTAARWKDYVRQALDEYTKQLEDKHNGGQPFPPRPGDQARLTPGRRAGISPRRIE